MCRGEEGERGCMHASHPYLGGGGGGGGGIK